MVNSRTKGADAERYIVKLLNEAGVDAEKVSRSGHPGPDLLVANDYAGEVKRRATQYSASQMEAHCAPVDFLFWRLDYGKWHVTMRLDVFTDMMTDA